MLDASKEEHMICPHCGKDINAQPVPIVNLLPNVNGCAAQPYPIITIANGWINTACAAGGAQPVGGTLLLTFGDNDKR